MAKNFLDIIYPQWLNISMTLKEFINQQKIALESFCKEIGLGASTSIYRYIRGERIPAPDVMRRIYVVTGGSVQPNDFYDLPPLDQVEEEEGKTT